MPATGRRGRYGKGSRSVSAAPRDKRFKDKDFTNAQVAVNWALQELDNWGRTENENDFNTVLAHIKGSNIQDSRKLLELVNAYNRLQRVPAYATLRKTLERHIQEIGGASVVKKKKRKLANLKKKSNLNFHSREQVLKNVANDTKKSATRALNVYKKFLKKHQKDDEVRSIVETLEAKLNPPIPSRGQVASKIKKMYKK